MRATISDSVQALAPELPRACAPLPQRVPDNGRNPQHAIARPRARRPIGCHRARPPPFPRRDSSLASSHRRTIIPRFLAVLGTQELAKVELARFLTDGREAVGDLGRAQAVLVSQPT